MIIDLASARHVALMVFSLQTVQHCKPQLLRNFSSHYNILIFCLPLSFHKFASFVLLFIVGPRVYSLYIFYLAVLQYLRCHLPVDVSYLGVYRYLVSRQVNDEISKFRLIHDPCFPRRVIKSWTMVSGDFCISVGLRISI